MTIVFEGDPFWLSFLEGLFIIISGAASIALVYLAYLGLGQIKEAKEAREETAEREKIKFTNDKLEYYINVIHERQEGLKEVLKENRINHFLNYSVEAWNNKDLWEEYPMETKQLFDTVTEKGEVVGYAMVTTFNSMETLAALVQRSYPIVDVDHLREMIGYMFCQSIREFKFYIAFYRNNNGAYDHLYNTYKDWQESFPTVPNPPS